MCVCECECECVCVCVFLLRKDFKIFMKRTLVRKDLKTFMKPMLENIQEHLGKECYSEDI